MSHATYDGREVVLDVLGPGALIGVMVLDGAPRSASIMTVEPCSMVVTTVSPLLDQVRTDPDLPEMGARVTVGAHAPVTVADPLGSPARPMDARLLSEKVEALAGDRLGGVLDDDSAPAAEVLAAAGLRG